MTNIQIDMDNNLNCNKELKELQENPMFKFSMSSLELFHSNFLEWLFDQNYSAFLKCFGIEVETNKEYTIAREFCLGSSKNDGKNKKWVTDIAVFAKDKNNIDEKCEDKPILIIENKIKSLPSNGQLESQAYFAGTRCKKVLLTLFELPTDYPLNGFTYIEYIELIEKIRELYESDTYFDPYIKDYCEMVKALRCIIDEDDVVIKNKEGIFAFNETSNLEKCGMQDASRKYQAARLLQRVERQLIENGEYKGLKVLTGTSLNHKRACVDIYLRLNNHLEAGVQIEHNQFRVIFQGKAVEKLFDKKIGKLLEKPYNFLDETWNNWLKIYDGKKDYCKYGTGFVYRYAIIPKNTKIDQLLVDGKWLKEYPDLSVKYILDKIIENKKEIIEKLYK